MSDEFEYIVTPFGDAPVPKSLSDEEKNAAVNEFVSRLTAEQEAQPSAWSRHATQLGGGFNVGGSRALGIDPNVLPDAMLPDQPRGFGERVTRRAGENLGAGTVAAGSMLLGTAPVTVGNRAIGLTNTARAAPNAVRGGTSAIANTGVARELQQYPLQYLAGETAASISSGFFGELAAEKGYPPLAGELFGGLLPQAATASAKLVTRQFFDFGVYDSFQRLGITPTMGQAGKGEWLSSVENFWSTYPGGSKPIKDATLKAKRQFRTYRDRLTRNFTRSEASAVGTPRQAGAAINHGLRRGFLGRFRVVSGQLFNDAASLIAPGRYRIDATRDALVDIASRAPNDFNTRQFLHNPTIMDIGEALANDAPNGMLDIQTLRAMRTNVGQMLDNAALVGDVPTGDLKRLYGALSNDLTEAARQNGPQALRLQNRANRYYGAGMKRIEDSLAPIWRKVEGEGFSPEAIFQVAVGESELGPTRLRALYRSLQPDERRIVTGTIMRRMGKVSSPDPDDIYAEGFSVFEFLDNWAKMDNEAKQVIFRQQGFSPTYINDVDNMAEVALRIKNRATAGVENIEAVSRQAAIHKGESLLRAPAGTITGGAVVGGGVGGGVATQNWSVAGIALATMGMANGASHLMGSPTFMHWLAQAQRVKPERLAGHIARLSDADLWTDPAVAGAVEEFMALMSGQDAADPQE